MNVKTQAFTTGLSQSIYTVFKGVFILSGVVSLNAFFRKKVHELI